MNSLTAMPTAELSSGLIVGNFSSPHAFDFDDGSQLPACDPDRVRAGSLRVKEDTLRRTTRFRLVQVRHELSDSAVDMLIESAFQPDVDLIIVPRIVISATVAFIGANELRRDHELWIALKKCVTIRMQDRQNKIAFHDRFCVG